ncbi:MAG TPA: hypothetical protein VGC06_18605 [Actinomycetes bacterium]
MSQACSTWALCSAGMGILPAAIALLKADRLPGGSMEGTEPPIRYEIRVEGVLDPWWSSWFDGLTISGDVSGQTTTISGPVTDQAALHGLLAKVRDLGLPLLAVRRLPPD